MATAKQLAALKKARAARAKKKKVAINAKSRATGKTPTKRLKKRRAANKAGPKGYYPNPSNFIIEVVMKRGGTGYLSDWKQNGPVADTLVSKAIKFPSRSLADKFANAIVSLKPVSVKSVEVKILGGVKKK